MKPEPLFLSEAKERLMKDRFSKEAPRCPCCNQIAKVYRRTINQTMARWLIALVRRYEMSPRYYSVAEDWSTKINRGTGDVAKLRYWGLIESDAFQTDDAGKRTSGRWRPTARGIAFANGQLFVLQYVLVYNSEPIGWEGGDVGIRDALGKRFNYDKLMAGAP